MKADIKNLKLAPAGTLKIDWAGQRMPVLKIIAERFRKEKILKGVRIGACLHVTAETANLVIALKNGGAEVALCASNPLSTQDDVAASLVEKHKIPVFAIKGEDRKSYYRHLQAVLAFKPNITMDDGADLVALILGMKKGPTWEFLGSSEETTTGVIRLKAMEKDQALTLPVVAVNDSYTKHLFDNRYGTGQSTLDGIMRATNVLLAGKKFVVAGYGWCGRGLASRARGMGAQVIVTEVEPLRALEAVMDGFAVMPIAEAAKIGDIFVTVTGDKGVVGLKELLAMKDGAIVANSGHFDVEIEIAALKKKAKKIRLIRPFLEEYLLPSGKRVYVLGEGRLINLAAAEGHPSEVMDLSFANQALAAEWFVQNRGQLKAKVYQLPEKLDKMVARLKLKSMGVKIDNLTAEQQKYLTSWSEGT